MFKILYKKLISIFCLLLIIVSSFVSAFTFANAAEEVIVQSFENYNHSLSASSGFSIYTATDANDTNVKDGTKSLKWTHTSGSKAIALCGANERLTVGETYKLEIWVKAVTSTGSGIDITQLDDYSNGWSYGSNKMLSLPYFGTDYASVGQWKKFEFTFTADKRGLGILIWGSDDFYFDAITLTPVKSEVTVNIVTNNDTDVTPLKGAPGGAMQLPTLTKDGHYFAGWYLDAEFKTPFTNLTVYPSNNITVYAKWILNGVLVQDFENYNHSLSASSGFSIYTATDANDTNVKDGTKSLKWTHTSSSKVATLYPGKALTVGETYKLEMWIKAVTSTGSRIEITHLSDSTNGWSYATNKISVPYFGTDYASVGQWKKFEFTFTAEKAAMGILIYGSDDFYFDSITWTAVKQDIEVAFVTNNDTTVDSVKGATGAALTLPTLTKDGYYFAGWFSNAEFTKPFSKTTFPEESVTLYAKWIENGVITQNFESYDHSLSANAGFELYTATDTNDTNVYEGEHSLYRSTVSSTKVAALSDKYIKFNIGKAYKLTFKLKVTELGTGGQIQFTDLKDRTNAWSYSKLSNMIYIGTDYKNLNEWVEISYIFIAESSYFGIASWGNISYYVDDFKAVEIPIVTVNFEMGVGEAKAPQSGAAGANLSIEKPTPPEGKSFAGWYLDEKFTESFIVSVYPETDITLYARWIEAGTFEQDFELWPGDGAFNTSKTFTLYTATDENDPNVYSGKHSMLYKNEDSGNTFALNIFDTTMGKLQIGEKYNISIRFKPVSTTLDRYASGGTYHSIYNTTQQDNCWAYKSQGPQGRYRAYVFYAPSFSDEYWSGTGNAVTTTTEKDENGWLTMNYEITATTPYIALYMTGYYSMFIDYITIKPLPSGVVATDYSLPYAEEYFNILSQNEISGVPNQQGKSVYKINVDTRSDYVFTASLAKGKNGSPKVYLAWDEKGEQKLEGTEFVGSTATAKIYSSRIMTDFSGALYIIVEGGGVGSSDYFSFFPTKYGCAEDPNPYYIHPTVDYNKLPSKLAAFISADLEDITDSENADNSPLTGDETPIMPVILLFVTVTGMALLTFRKRGNCNE